MYRTGTAKSIKISHVFGTCKVVKTPPKLCMSEENHGPTIITFLAIRYHFVNICLHLDFKTQQEAKSKK